MMQNNTQYTTNIKFNVKILETSPQLVNLGEKKNQLMGWVKKYFHLDNVSIANNNDKSLEFYLPGAGLTEKEALNNAKEKSLKIRDALETKFGCRLAVPTAYPETHPSLTHMTISNIEKPTNDKRMQLGIKVFGEVYFSQQLSGLILGECKDLQGIFPQGSRVIRNRKFPSVRIHIKSLALKKLVGIAANHIMNHLVIRVVNFDDVKNLKSNLHNEKSALSPNKNIEN